MAPIINHLASTEVRITFVPNGWQLAG